MDAWQRETHRAVQRVLEAAGAGVAFPGSGGDCCGALHVHAGLSEEGHALGERALASMPGDAPVLVDSAGCGAALKDRDTTGRVLDVHEWLAARVDVLPSRDRDGSVRSSPCRTRATSATCRRPTSRCGWCSSATPTSSSSTTRASAAAPAAPTRRSSRSSRRRSGTARSTPSPAPGHRSSLPPTPGARYHLAGAGVRRAPPVGDRRRRDQMWPVSSTTSVGGWRPSARSSPIWPSSASANRSMPAARSFPSTSAASLAARRAVEKAIGILSEPDGYETDHG